MNSLSRVAVFSLGWLACGHAGINPLVTRFELSDAVVIGEPKGARLSEGRKWIVDIAIEDVLKGSMAVGSTVSGVDTGQTGGHMQPGRRGIFFLRGNPQTGFLIMRPTRIVGSIEAAYYVTPVRAAPPPASRMGLARVLFEVNEALKAPRLDHTRSILSSLVFELCGDEMADWVIVELRRSPDAGNRALAAAMGLCRGYPQSVNEIVRESGVLFNSPGVGELRSALARIEVYTPSVIALFDHIMTSTDGNIRAAISDVAVSLRRVHSRDAVPLMLRLLDDDRAAVREHALCGLSRFVDGYPVETHKAVVSMEAITRRKRTEFATAETDQFNSATKRVPEGEHAAHVAAWKRWWAQNRNRLAP